MNLMWKIPKLLVIRCRHQLSSHLISSPLFNSRNLAPLLAFEAQRVMADEVNVAPMQGRLAAVAFPQLFKARSTQFDGNGADRRKLVRKGSCGGCRAWNSGKSR